MTYDKSRVYTALNADELMVTGYDPREDVSNNVFFGGEWYNNNELTDWEKI